MNKVEWAAERKRRQEAYKNFVVRNFGNLLEVDVQRKKLRELEALHAEILRRQEELKESAELAAPEGHVRCQAIHHGRLICDEIAELGAVPRGWARSLVGDLNFCPEHADCVAEVNAPTIAASLARVPQSIKEVDKRR